MESPGKETHVSATTRAFVNGVAGLAMTKRPSLSSFAPLTEASSSTSEEVGANCKVPKANAAAATRALEMKVSPHQHADVKATLSITALAKADPMKEKNAWRLASPVLIASSSVFGPRPSRLRRFMILALCACLHCQSLLVLCRS